MKHLHPPDEPEPQPPTVRSSRICTWCRGPLPCGARSGSVYCGKRCRQAAWRFHRQISARELADRPLRLAYADPPYPGLSAAYYADHPDYAGEVDHRKLLSRLQAHDGWALSTSARPGLRLVLGLCDELGIDVRVAAWVRGARHGRSAWPASSWEPVVYAGGRQLPDASPACRSDALVLGVRARTTDPARVIGAKPAAFVDWMFDLLGARVGDTLDDLYPGSGGVGRAWRVLQGSRPGEADASVTPRGDASREYSDDVSGEEGAR